MRIVRTSPAAGSGLLLLLALAGAGPARPAARDIYAKAAPACVEILVNERLSGSGAFLTPDGVVLTASHVPGAPGRKIEVRSRRIGRLPAKVIAVDRGHDLALLRVQKGRPPYPALRLAEKTPAVGADVWLFGAPLFRHQVMAHGRVARAKPTFEYLHVLHGYAEVYFICGPAPLGMSGGPWLNQRGEIAGMQSGYIKQKDAPTGVVFAAPVEAIRALLSTRRTAETPTLGMAVEEVWEQTAKFFKRIPRRAEGLVVRVLQQDGPAARAGVRLWDVVIEADGKPVKYRDELLRAVSAKKPGDRLTLTILRPDGAGKMRAAPVLGCLEIQWLRAAP